MICIAIGFTYKQRIQFCEHVKVGMRSLDGFYRDIFSRIRVSTHEKRDLVAYFKNKAIY